MARTKGNPGAGGTGVSGKNVPVKNKLDNSQTSRSTQRRKREPVENRAGASTRRAYVVYNGQQLLGSFVLNEATDEALAWNASRCFVGQFKGYKAAARGTRRAAATEQHAAEARRRLADPNPPFVTGLSEHFLRHGR